MKRLEFTAPPAIVHSGCVDLELAVVLAVILQQ